ncbi:hypothetical protein M404DRAFT_1009360 [Pisolithus tinctorius Marx 270]|uniref:Uncharacterized protein n=1 Tax=Pisolithus tinctorius Marx 270 TaxID=870435 RepID=A0A0C3J545_PISTI|nr:hypothetical protein M404DRAFT_1009360 [Pisolithus tinctorius Marx 270]
MPGIQLNQIPLSALTITLASSGGSSNPFGQLHATVPGCGETRAVTDVKVFFPHTRQPKGEAKFVKVRKDATVECGVIGKRAGCRS